MKINISKEEWQKLKYWTAHAKGEIGGFGTAYIQENGDINIEQVMLTKQTTTGAHVDHDDEGLNDFAREHADIAEHIKLQWHSHAKMEAFFSTTDTENIDGLINTGMEWMLSLVINKKLDYKIRLDTGKPFRMSLPEITLEIEQEEIAIPQEWTNEFDQQVTEQAETVSKVIWNPVDYRGQMNIGADNELCTGCFKHFDGQKYWKKSLGGYVCDDCFYEEEYEERFIEKTTQMKKQNKCDACENQLPRKGIAQIRKDIDGNDAILCKICVQEWDELEEEEQKIIE